MAGQESLPQWMNTGIRHSKVAWKPILRILACCLSVSLVLLATNDIIHHRDYSRNFPIFSSPGRLTFGPAPGRQSLETSRDQYSPPKDIIVPPNPGNGIATESSIGKITMLVNSKNPTYIRAIQSHEAHNQRYGYSLMVLRHGLIDGGSLDGIWNKPAYVLAALLEEMRKPPEHRLKWLFWFDGDTVITNPLIPLDIFLPPNQFPHIHILVSADPAGINNGVFFIRVHPWSVDFFSAIVAFTIYKPTFHLTYRDQSAFSELLALPMFCKNYLLLPQRWFNAYQADLEDDSTHKGQLRRGDLLVHFAGVPDREEHMRMYLERAERHLPEWELALSVTSYPNEVKTFWDRQLDILSESRENATKAVNETRFFLSVTNAELQKYNAELDNADKDRIREAIDDTNSILRDDRKKEDEDAIRDALSSLRNATTPLTEIVNRTYRSLLKDAHALIVDAAKTLFKPHADEASEKVSAVHERIEELREWLAGGEEKMEGVRERMDRLRKAYRELDEAISRSDIKAAGN